MKKIYQCPHCGSILLKDRDTKEDFWQKLDLNELVALKTIQQSFSLLVITDPLTVIPTICDLCLDIENPRIHLN